MFITNLSGGCCKLEIVLELSHGLLLFFYRIYLHDNVKDNAKWSFMIGLYDLIEYCTNLFP